MFGGNGMSSALYVTIDLTRRQAEVLLQLQHWGNPPDCDISTLRDAFTKLRVALALKTS